jgi:acetylglutamate kinase
MSSDLENIIAAPTFLSVLKQLSAKVIVIKCGGAALIDPLKITALMKDVAFLQSHDIRVVIVHGGGPDISAFCQRLNLPTQFIKGQRVTDAATLEVVQMVLCGKTNRALVSTLNCLGVKAVGFSGQDAGLIQAQKYSDPLEGDLGFIGDITKIDPTLIRHLLTTGYLPVISPIGSDTKGQAYNINADIVAGAIAAALGSERLIFLSDVNGFYADPQDPSTRLSSIKAATVRQWIQEGNLSGGMIPKLQACLNALDAGVASAELLDGNIPHSLLKKIFTTESMGTTITK